jgi:hypothetical protein
MKNDSILIEILDDLIRDYLIEEVVNDNLSQDELDYRLEKINNTELSPKQRVIFLEYVLSELKSLRSIKKFTPGYNLKNIKRNQKNIKDIKRTYGKQIKHPRVKELIQQGRFNQMRALGRLVAPMVLASALIAYGIKKHLDSNNPDTIRDTIVFLNSKKNLCQYSKDRQKCIEAIDKKIEKLKTKWVKNKLKQNRKQQNKNYSYSNEPDDEDYDDE